MQNNHRTTRAKTSRKSPTSEVRVRPWQSVDPLGRPARLWLHEQSPVKQCCNMADVVRGIPSLGRRGERTARDRSDLGKWLGRLISTQGLGRTGEEVAVEDGERQAVERPGEETPMPQRSTPEAARMIRTK